MAANRDANRAARDAERVAMIQRIAEMSAARDAERAASDARLLVMGVSHSKMLETMERLTHMALASNTSVAKIGPEESSEARVVADRMEESVVDEEATVNIADL